MIEPASKCSLCSLAIEVEHFSVQTIEGHKSFCCEGCLSVYSLLNGDKILVN